jgi:hypothetical protein
VRIRHSGRDIVMRGDAVGQPPVLSA